MNKSGLTGNVSSAVFCIVALMGILPSAVKSLLNGAPLGSANWLMVIGAGFFGALGLLAFNNMLAGATPDVIGTLFITMIMVQIAVPALYQILYQIIVIGEFPLVKLVGIVTAALAAYLLA